MELFSMEVWALVMFAVLMFTALLGYPVAFTLGAVALLFGLIFLDVSTFNFLPMRIWGIMTNFTLSAVPLFIFMGLVLEKSKLAEELLGTMGLLFGSIRGGLALSIIVVGALLAATTGVVGATVVTMGIIALPVMLKNNYSPTLATGTIAASGTLGQIIPPSIILILLGDMMGVPVGRIFVGAVIPGLVLIGLYVIYILIKAWRQPNCAPALANNLHRWNKRFFLRVIKSVVPVLVLVFFVLGSIFFGIATPTESAAFGALGALILALLYQRFSWQDFSTAMQQTTRLTSMVFLILIGATAFSLVFREMGGNDLVHDMFTQLPGDVWGFLIISLAIIFVLGFFLDFLEICFIVVPILAPIAEHLGIDLLWFAILIAVNLQTSFLTPPFGFSLFYLKGVSPPEIQTSMIYRGIIPFVILQLVGLALFVIFPQLVLWLPNLMDKIQGF